jgi:dienelactone hydrolase
MILDDFSLGEFSYKGDQRTIYRKGEGPGVVIMHEVPGITPEVAQFARYVAEAGFTAVMPHLFGEPGKPISNGYILSGIARACVSREFHVMAKRESSPITDWLRALCRQVHQECGGPGVGAIGMCLTGNFALSLMVDESVMAPVLSQPSLPFGVSAEHRKAIHLSDEDLEVVKRRSQSGCPVLGLKFTHDPMCPPERFETLRRELGNGFEGIEIDSSKGNAAGIPRSAHSVVTTDLIYEDGHPTRKALERVLGFFAEQLRPSGSEPTSTL